MMPSSINCPACGAPLPPTHTTDPQTGGRELRCDFCASVITLPDELHPIATVAASTHHLSMPPPEDEIAHLLMEDRKVEAVRRYGQLHNTFFARSLVQVSDLENELGAQGKLPYSLSQRNRRGNACFFTLLGLIVALAGAGVLVWWYWL